MSAPRTAKMMPRQIFEGKKLRFDDRGDRPARHHLHFRGLDHPSRHRDLDDRLMRIVTVERHCLRDLAGCTDQGLLKFSVTANRAEAATIAIRKNLVKD